MELAFPVEFLVRGAPVSLQASARSRIAWKDRVASTARAAIAARQGSHFLSAASVSLTVLHVAQADSLVDLDNIIKPIADVLINVVYLDNRQVERIVLQRLDMSTALRLAAEAEALATTLAAGPPIVYIRIVDTPIPELLNAGFEPRILSDD